ACQPSLAYLPPRLVFPWCKYVGFDKNVHSNGCQRAYFMQKTTFEALTENKNGHFMQNSRFHNRYNFVVMVMEASLQTAHPSGVFFLCQRQKHRIFLLVIIFLYIFSGSALMLKYTCKRFQTL
ncbi:hypothetical protein SAMN05518855_103620, partial [Paenibacillus sp. CF384]